jgi:hypothetical protein
MENQNKTPQCVSENIPTSVPVCDSETHQRHHLHWKNTKEYQMEFCPHCSYIRSFWFKSFWKRIKSVFKNETLS